MSRGPYRKRPRLKVTDEQWFAGDVVPMDNCRWIIRSIGRDGMVELVLSNHENAVRRTIPITQLPAKVARR